MSNIVSPSAELFDPPVDYLEFLERCTRVCYKSEDKISPGSAKKLLTKVVKGYKHLSVTEHVNLILQIRANSAVKIKIFDLNPLLRMSWREEEKDLIISGNIRMWLDLFKKSDELSEPIWLHLERCLHEKLPFFFRKTMEHHSSRVRSLDENPVTNADKLTPTEMKEHMTATVKFVGNRSFSHQLVRHRKYAFSQECLSGDTIVSRFSNGRKSLTIKELYDRQFDVKLKGRNKLMQLRSINQNNILVPNKMVCVMKSGFKDVYEVSTKLGYKIKTSMDHKFFNSKGEIRLKDLSVEDKIYVNGKPLYQDKDWFEDKYKNGFSTTKIAALCNIATSTARKWKRIHKIKVDYRYKSHTAWNKGLSEDDHPSVKKQAISLRKNHHDNGSSSLNSNWEEDSKKLTKSGLRLRFSRYKREQCELCGSKKHLENHHRDQDITNWKEDNKVTLCGDCHRMTHKGFVIKKVVLDEIISIKSVGKEMTYDIEMEAPYHNFVANGFIVHNSQRYCDYGKKGFQFIIPPRIRDSSATPYGVSVEDGGMTALDFFVNAALSEYQYYLNMREMGVPAEDARDLLPNCTKTEIITTGTLGYWVDHIFPHRGHNKAAQWLIRELMLSAESQMMEKIPEIF